MPVKQALRSIFGKLTTPVSWRGITNKTDIGAHVTVQKYVTALEDSFVLNVLYPLDLPKKTASFKKRKNLLPGPLHLPCSSHLGFRPDRLLRILKPLPEQPRNQKQTRRILIHSHLVRFMYEKYPSDVFSPHDRIFYLKTSGGKKEVDFVLKENGNKLLGIELKYQNRTNSSDYRGLTAFERRILI